MPKSYWWTIHWKRLNFNFLTTIKEI